MGMLKLDPKRRRPRLTPERRGTCEGPGDCPAVACRHHLAVDVVTRPINHRPRAPRFPVRVDVRDGWDGVGAIDDRPTCSLDFAEGGPRSRKEVAAALGISRSAVWKLELSALSKLPREIQAYLLEKGRSSRNR